jgi:2'-hydroxyisoflavone reductase
VRLLLLGGTQFVGRTVAAAALAGGHDVTLFHRGRTGADLFPEAEHLLGDRDGGLDALRGRDWDACVDVSGYLPRLVRDSSELLRDAVSHLVFVSTISVYADLAVPRDEDGPLAALDDPTTEEIGGGTYGGLKVLCEQSVRETLGDRAGIVRPGYIVGPHDHTGRFTWWVHRAVQGGTLPLPASIHRRAQFIDVRDLADFLLHAAVSPLAGTYNATGPLPAIGMGDVLQEAARASTSTSSRLRRTRRCRAEVAFLSDTGARLGGMGEVDARGRSGLSFRPLGQDGARRCTRRHGRRRRADAGAGAAALGGMGGGRRLIAGG